jgi:hypothetical protein
MHFFCLARVFFVIGDMFISVKYCNLSIKLILGSIVIIFLIYLIYTNSNIYIYINSYYLYYVLLRSIVYNQFILYYLSNSLTWWTQCHKPYPNGRFMALGFPTLIEIYLVNTIPTMLRWYWKCYSGWGQWVGFFPYWEFHHPNWRTHIFQRGRSTTNQILSCPKMLRWYCKCYCKMVSY